MKRHIQIKGKNIWQLLALVVLGIVISCCGTELDLLNPQPTTATVGQTLTIPLQAKYCNTYGTPDMKLVVGILMPTGWIGSKNTVITANSNALTAPITLKPMDPALLEKQSQLPWAQAALNKFGIENNYINDMQWVFFISDNTYTAAQAGQDSVKITVNLKVGADKNNAIVNLNYVLAEDRDGLRDPDHPGDIGAAYNNCSYPAPFEYFEVVSGPTLTVSGGTPGTLLDYAHPQLSTIDPPRALIDDYITINFFGNYSPPTVLKNQAQVYLQATAYTTDNTPYPVMGQVAKTLMAQTTTTSNIYNISIWPRSYFGLPDDKTLDRIEYLISDGSGSKLVGKDSLLTKFVYKFNCANQ